MRTKHRSRQTNMGKREPQIGGFTVSELMLVVAVIFLLIALALPALGKAKASAQRTVCLNHLRQIATSIRMYADDMEDVGPAKISEKKSLDGWTAYKQLTKSYLGDKTTSSPKDKLFACPADKYHYDFTSASPKAYVYIGKPVYEQAWSDYSSYAFNGGNTRSNTATGDKFPGIAGQKLSSIREPSKTILVAEMPAFYCFSWHEPKNPKVAHYFTDARNMAAFVDGHVNYIKIYYDPNQGQKEAWQYDPPPSYDYKWSGN